MKGSLRILFALVAVVALMTATGCAAMFEKAVTSGIESATGVKVDTSGDAVTVTGADGSSTTVGGKELPAGFPSEVPVYEGTISSAMNNKSAKGDVFVVGIDAADLPADVASWYDEQLKSGGWTIDQTLNVGEATVLQATKLPTTITVNIAPGSGEAKSAIVLTVGPK